jgi:hypothetical protein
MVICDFPLSPLTPLESPAIPACRQTGIAGIIKMNNIHLRKGRV